MDALVQESVHNMVFNVTVSACMAAVLAGSQTIRKAHVSLVAAHTRRVCSPSPRAQQAGGALGFPFAPKNICADAYGAGAGAHTEAGAINFAAGEARPAHDVSQPATGTGGWLATGGGAALDAAWRKQLRARMADTAKEYDMRLAKDARAELAALIEQLCACFLQEVAKYKSVAQLERALDARRFKVFAA